MTTIPLNQAKGWAPERRVRQRRDFAAVEERRTPAANLFEQGVRPAEIARQLGVPSDCLGLAERVAAVRQGRTARRWTSRTAAERGPLQDACHAQTDAGTAKYASAAPI